MRVFVWIAFGFFFDRLKLSKGKLAGFGNLRNALPCGWEHTKDKDGLYVLKGIKNLKIFPTALSMHPIETVGIQRGIRNLGLHGFCGAHERE